MNFEEKKEFDRLHVWHPYSGMTTPRFAQHIVESEGVWMFQEDGRKIIDGISSWWTMAHGHRHPKIVNAMIAQLQKMPHIMFGGLTHDPAIMLTEKLLKKVPAGLDKVFYSDSGSVACEVAMKMALQYFYARNELSRSKFLTVEHTYHGDTFGTMALSKGSGMHEYFGHLLSGHFTAKAPTMGFDNFQESDLLSARRILEEHSSEIAGIMLEPILQGAGGMRIYSPKYLSGLRQLCDEFDVLLILDEIATGFGRTGEFFASSHAEITPDIMCVGKALTGGHITLAATLTTEKVAQTISNGPPGALMHGPTFMANPVACAAACASLDLFDEYKWKENVRHISEQLSSELEATRKLSAVKDVRVIGATGIVEMKNSIDCDKYCEKFIKRGCWIRPFDRFIYLMPPFIIESEELSTLTSSIIGVIKEENE